MSARRALIAVPKIPSASYARIRTARIPKPRSRRAGRDRIIDPLHGLPRIDLDELDAVHVFMDLDAGMSIRIDLGALETSSANVNHPRPPQMSGPRTSAGQSTPKCPLNVQCDVVLAQLKCPLDVPRLSGRTSDFARNRQTAKDKDRALSSETMHSGTHDSAKITCNEAPTRP